MSDMRDMRNTSPQAEGTAIGNTGTPGVGGDTGTTTETGTSDESTRLDGNAAAGMLAEIFMYEMTSAQSTCAHCACVAPLGALLMYGGQTGTILRCPTCGQVELRIMHIPEQGGQRGQYCLDMRGMALMRIALSTSL